jgi:excisionase family DNA binding protein
VARPASRFEPEPIRAHAEDAPLLEVLREAMEAPGARASAARLLSGDGEPLELPESVYRMLVETVRELAEGNAVAVLPVRAEVTTQEAADLLGVSRPYLIKLIEDRVLPCTLTAGQHRRLRLSDVLAYRRVRDQERRAALDEMSAEAERLGLRY